MKSARTKVAPPPASSPSPSTGSQSGVQAGVQAGGQAAAQSAGAPPAAGWPTPRPGPAWLVHVPTLLALLCFLPLTTMRVQQNAHLFWTFVAVPGALLLWRLGLLVAGRTLAVETLPPIQQHYVQASVQICLYLFWGYHWQLPDGVRPIYAQAPLILVQFAFLYAFDALLAWTRGRPWRLASGPTPIVLSTNLFIWFRDDWFAWQFAMVSLGLLGKEFLKWTKDGRRTHVFNPSGFGLACAATVLIATGTSDLTWVKELATTIEVPGIYLFLFGLGMVVQWFFRVTLMTFAAALAMVAVNLLYTWWTGVYLFASTNLPAAAFLGLHLLMTDPSTSPRSNVGRTLFGLGYGLGYIVVFEVLGWLGAPELYAKLYPVPILNCCVQWLDRMARRGALGRLNARWEAGPPVRTNLAHMTAWAATFVVLLATGYVYGLDRTPHPGDSIAFWKQAQAEGRHDAARKLVMVAGSHAAAGHEGDAYNELGILSMAGEVDAEAEKTRIKSAADWFGRGMARGSEAAHENMLMLGLYRGSRRSDEEYGAALQNVLGRAQRGGRAAQLVGLVFETGGGVPVDAGKALAAYRLAKDDPWAVRGIVRLGLAGGAVLDLAPHAPAMRAAAEAVDAECCYYLACMLQLGRGVAKDEGEAKRWFLRAVELGYAPAVAVHEKDGKTGVVRYQAPPRKQLGAPPWSTAFPVSTPASTARSGS